MKRPMIANAQTGVVVGLILVVSGFVVLHDAYDGHGRKKPAIFGPFLPW